MKQMAVIFDIDGTIVWNHTFHEGAWVELSAKYGSSLSREEYRTRFHGRPNPEIIEILQTRFGHQITPADFVREKEELYRSNFGRDFSPAPGIDAFISLCEIANIPTGIASNGPRDNVDFILNSPPFLGRFQAICSGSDVERGKPHPEMYLKVAEELGAAPGETVAFEDSPSGAEAALAAGMKLVIIKGDSPVIASHPIIEQASLVLESFVGLELKTLEELFSGRVCQSG